MGKRKTESTAEEKASYAASHAGEAGHEETGKQRRARRKGPTLPPTVAERASFAEVTAKVRYEIMSHVTLVTAPEYMTSGEAIDFLDTLTREIAEYTETIRKGRFVDNA